jgi:hypothetical protein
MEVDGGGISLTFSGRTRDSRFGLISNRSDLVYRSNRPRSDPELHHLETGRGSLPMLNDDILRESFSKRSRIGYITTK